MSNTFGGMRINPVSGMAHKPRSKSTALNIFFLGSTSRAIAHQRSLIPSKYLAKAKAANCGIMFGRFTKETIDWADVVVFQRVGGRVIENLARYCRLKDIATIYDFDDDLFNYPETKEYETVDTEKVKIDVLNMMQLVDCIAVTEESIKESAAEYTKTPINIVPNYIDFEHWEAPENIKKASSDITIGWAGGHYHSADLKIIEEPLKHILRKYPNVKFVSVGDKIDSLFKEFKDRVYYHEFVDIADYPKLMHKLQLSIGLAPLSHSKFSDSRSNIRLLHHSVLAIPTVASSFGPYLRAVEEGFPLIAVDNTVEEWCGAIQQLIEDRQQRTYIGLAAREAVYQQYRAEKLVPKWMGIIWKSINISKLRKENS
jgi:glycosyltransferase involved in cell wall biosynthesis